MKWLTVNLNFLTLLSMAFGDQPVKESEIKSIEYNSEEFAKNINLKNHFVMFYAPWSSDCKRLFPIWEQLAEMLNEDESRVIIAQVDCTKATEICSEQDITGYPTLKYFSTDNLEPVKFRGIHELTYLTMFLNVQMGSSLGDGTEKKIEIESATKEITDQNYKSFLSSGNHFVKFYASWCGHCQRLAPTWEALGNSFINHKMVSIGKVDCTVHKETCNAYNIKSYPTLLWIEENQKVDKYQGQRSLDDLTEYVLERLDQFDSSANEESAKDKSSQSSSPVVSLTANNFKSAINKHLAFVKFFAPWCGHCKGLAPTWEDLAKKLTPFSNVLIAKVDCTLEVNKDLCIAQEVAGFPTLLLYSHGEKLEEYMGTRGLEELYEYVYKHFKHDEL